MPREALNSIDDYEGFLWTTLENWSPEQRIALAAAMAERWLPAYEEFSKQEEWGDAASLRRSLEAVWGCVAGQTLSKLALSRHAAQLRDSTPHMDDFDAEEALAACMILSDALECCGTADNVLFAVRATLSAFEAVAPEWALDPDSQPDLWRQIGVRKELRKQLKLLDQISAGSPFDEDAIKALRKNLGKPEFAGEPMPQPKSGSGLPGLTNQAAFEQYRRMVESDLKGKRPGPRDDVGGNPIALTIMLFGEWFGRYKRRQDTLNGNYGRLADEAGVQALVARQRAHDANEREIPAWDSSTRQMIDLCLQNRMNGLDVHSLEESHGYGPSLRRLWAEARRQGESDAWRHVIAWARHRPAAWEAEDRRKKKGLAHATPELGEHLGRHVTWTANNDVDHPWTAKVDGACWRVGLNDFPDALMYCLKIGDARVGDFHDWPETWQRP
jgi:uncharacterized protein YjaG (DUF416 family)